MKKEEKKAPEVKGKVEFKALETNQVQREHEWNNTFFSTQAAFSFDGRYITIDFQRVAPRTDPTKHVEVIEHNAVMLDVFHAKDFAEKFRGLVEALEAQFGNLEAPQFLKNVQSQAQVQIAKTGQQTSTAEVPSMKDKPSYLG